MRVDRKGHEPNDETARDPETRGGDPQIAPLTKLVSRIPPPPRVPRVDGVSSVAPTAQGGQPPAEDSRPVSRRQLRHGSSRVPAERVQAYGVLLAAALAAALFAWWTSGQ